MVGYKINKEDYEKQLSEFSLANLEGSFNKLNLSLYDEEFAAQLLAFHQLYFYEIGEQAVLNVVFREALKICAKKFNIVGGKVPKRKAVIKINCYLKEARENLNLDWVKKIIERYNLKISKKK